MTPVSFDRYLQNRLEQWADWCVRGNFYGLGYPPCSLEYRLLTEGRPERHPGFRPLPSHEPAEEIEDMVREMAQHNVTMAHALRCQYLMTGSLRTRAAYLNVSHSHFKHYVDMAHQWLAGRLSAKKRFERERI